MAESEGIVSGAEDGADVEMEEEIVETVGAENGDDENVEPTGLEGIEPDVPVHTTFLE